MSARVPPGFAELWQRFVISLDAEPMFFACGIDLAVGVGASVAVADAIVGASNANIRSLVSTQATCDGGYVLFGQDGGDLRIDATTAPAAGLGGATQLPPNCALLVRKITALGGRRQRGRFFIPGTPNLSVNTAGVMTGAQRATYQTAINQWRTALIALAEVDDLVLLHDSAPFTPTPLTEVEVQAKLATQRRRLRP